MGRRWRIDDGTAEGILAGTVDEHGVTGPFAEVVSLLRAARRASPVGEPVRREGTLAAMAAAATRSAAGAAAGSGPAVVPARVRLSGRAKLATGAAVGAMTLFGGLTAAAALSGSVSDAVHDATGVRLPLSAEQHQPAGPPTSTAGGTAGHGPAAGSTASCAKATPAGDKGGCRRANGA